MCEHIDTREIMIVGQGVRWVVCNDCERLINVLKGYHSSNEVEK